MYKVNYNLIINQNELENIINGLENSIKNNITLMNKNKIDLADEFIPELLLINKEIKDLILKLNENTKDTYILNQNEVTLICNGLDETKSLYYTLIRKCLLDLSEELIPNLENLIKETEDLKSTILKKLNKI